MKIILGSQSKNRKARMEAMGFEFEVMPADIDERAIRRDDPRELVEVIANAKMDAILPRVKGDAIVITSDLVMLVDDVVREKPESDEEAYQFIKTFSSKPQISLSGTVVVNTANGKRRSFFDEVTVTFDEIPEENIKKFIESGEAKFFAGALAAQSPLFEPYIHIKGEWESLLGLPKAKTLAAIEEVTKKRSRS